MTHVMEQASTGRSQCKVCGRKIARGELRFGERRSNAFGEGETTLWFHPLCAAYARPEPLLELMSAQSIEGLDALRPIAELGAAHPRLTRVNGAERSPTSRASCRRCHKPIEKDSWRLALMFFEEFRFNAAGFIHAACAHDYLGDTGDIIERLKHFNPDLPAEELEALQRAMALPST